jgi:AcrR family transcriptional regulator
MAYPKLLSSAEILKAAIHLMEHGHADGISLRAVASALGVKAPSLYRYFPDKDALELAVAEEALRAMLAELQTAAITTDSESRFRETVDAYLRFARKRFSVYSFIMNRIPKTHGSGVGKAVWNLLLEAASGVSGKPDDTAAAVATWSFLHGYVTLEHSGAFGASGPKGGLDLGVAAFLNNFRSRAEPIRNGHSTRAAAVRGGKRQEQTKGTDYRDSRWS